MIAQADNKKETIEYDGKTPLKGKREKFAQLVATGTKNNTEAYREAGYRDWKGCRRYAHELATNVSIKARIAYIEVELAKKWDITKESQVKEYIAIRGRAVTSGDLRAEISANNSIDKLCGLIVDRSVVEQTTAQVARIATERREAALYAQWKLEQRLSRPEGLEGVNVVDIRDSEGKQDE